MGGALPSPESCGSAGAALLSAEREGAVRWASSEGEAGAGNLGSKMGQSWLEGLQQSGGLDSSSPLLLAWKTAAQLAQMWLWT